MKLISCSVIDACPPEASSDPVVVVDNGEIVGNKRRDSEKRKS